MENFIKALSISLLMSGSFIINAMDSEEEDKAQQLGMTLREYRRQVSAQQQFFSQPKPQTGNADMGNSDEEMARQLGMTLSEYRRQVSAQQQIFSHPKFPTDNTDSELEQALAASRDMSVPAYWRQLEKEQQDKASVELARRLQKEQDERASINLIRQLQQEQAEKDSADLARRFQQTHIREESSFKSQIQQKTQAYSREAAHRPILEKYTGIFEYLNKIPQGSDVHVLDQYVFGSHKMIDSLLEVGRLYNIDNPNLTLAQVGQEMIMFVNDHKDFFNIYKYEANVLTSERVIEILKSHFSNMDAEARAVSPAAREVWSRAWTLAFNLYNRDGDSSAIQVIFDQAVEGHLTRGGCIQGRIDRGFVGYVSLLAKSGVNLD